MYHSKRNHAFRGLVSRMKKYSVNPVSRTIRRLRSNLKTAPTRLKARAVLNTFLKRHAPGKRAATRHKLVGMYSKRRYPTA